MSLGYRCDSSTTEILYQILVLLVQQVQHTGFCVCLCVCAKNYIMLQLPNDRVNLVLNTLPSATGVIKINYFKVNFMYILGKKSFWERADSNTDKQEFIGACHQ